MEYIEKTLGITMEYQPWKYEAELPYYLLERYEIQQAVLQGVKAIFLYPKTELEQIAAIKKQIARIQKLEPLPVVLVLKNINRYRREYLLSANIPFVVPDKQLYLPFLGVALQEKYDADLVATERLQPASQVLFFHYLYEKKRKLYLHDATEKLGFSAMTITRVARQLEQTGYFSTEKEGVQKILVGKYDRRTLFEKMQPHLIAPVKKRVYIKKSEEVSKLLTAGLSALSQFSMINPPNVACYAAEGKVADWEGTTVLMDALLQIEVEVWKYAPHILGKNGTVDPLSLVMSLKDNTDERIAEAITALLETVWECI